VSFVANRTSLSVKGEFALGQVSSQLKVTSETITGDPGKKSRPPNPFPTAVSCKKAISAAGGLSHHRSLAGSAGSFGLHASEGQFHRWGRRGFRPCDSPITEAEITEKGPVHKTPVHKL
jgi:hypothetical protein